MRLDRNRRRALVIGVAVLAALRLIGRCTQQTRPYFRRHTPPTRPRTARKPGDGGISRRALLGGRDGRPGASELEKPSATS